MSRSLQHLRVIDQQGLIIGSNNALTLSTTGLTTPRIISYPDATDTLICKTTTDTLTNKTLIGTSNDIEANRIGQGINSVTVSGSTNTGKVLTSQSSRTAEWIMPTLFYNSSGVIASPKIFADNKTVTGSTVTFDLRSVGFSNINSITMTAALISSSTAIKEQLFCCIQSKSNTSVTATIVSGTSIPNNQSVTVYVNVIGS